MIGGNRLLRSLPLAALAVGALALAIVLNLSGRQSVPFSIRCSTLGAKSLCIIGMAGVVLGSGLLAQGSIVGGALFLLALIPLSMTFLREAQG